MTLTRRAFVSGTFRGAVFLAGGLPFIASRASLAQPDVAPRMRLENFVKDPKRVTAVKRAV